MRRFQLLVVLLGLVPCRGLADPAQEVRDAMNALVRVRHGWETTAREQFRCEYVQPRRDHQGAVEVRGAFEPSGLYAITLEPSRDVPAPVTAIFRAGDVVATAPNGWVHRGDLRKLAGPDREIDFAGARIRLSRVLGAALKASAMKPLTEDLFDLLPELSSFRRDGGWIVADLSGSAIDRLWQDRQPLRTPERQGTVSFQLGNQGLLEVQILIATGAQNSRTLAMSWSLQQWTIRVSGVGTTYVSAPTAALRALDD